MLFLVLAFQYESIYSGIKRYSCKETHLPIRWSESAIFCICCEQRQCVEHRYLWILMRDLWVEIAKSEHLFIVNKNEAKTIRRFLNGAGLLVNRYLSMYCGRRLIDTARTASPKCNI